MYYLAENIELRRQEFADRLSLQTGRLLTAALMKSASPYRDCSTGQRTLTSMVALCRKPRCMEPLANCVVIVPSEIHPLSALDLYQVFETSDIPGGVVNILTGSKDHLAKYLVEHQDIQSVWYFGSEAGSKYVEYVSAENVKRTWVNYGLSRKWEDPEQGEGEEFLYQVTQVKNIWIPMGDIFAN
ncbi:aldh16a1 [Bugula neritina]|uniref:Aldh16a1 n=1 Tax=Bugula neritina TaxID=10212 RepID=A0A7J7KJW3_BUGNE|nr:aldh16a1 [Bugula neritina]